MKIGLFGFGKAGKAVANVILQHKDFILEWVVRDKPLLENRSASEFLGVDSSDPARIFSIRHTSVHSLLNMHPVDLLIDFSSERSIQFYASALSKYKVKLLSAVSHYNQSEQELLKDLSLDTVVFWSPNITLGVNYLLFSGKFLKQIAPWVDIQIIEEHFKDKRGVSGTAVKIAEALDLESSEINSVRAGGIVGKHEIIFGFPYQTVRLIHESVSREAFGNGALFIAEQLKLKSNGLYNFESILLEEMQRFLS